MLIVLVGIVFELLDVAADWAFYVSSNSSTGGANIDTELRWLLALNLFITIVLCATALATLPTILRDVCCKKAKGCMFVEKMENHKVTPVRTDEGTPFSQMLLNFLFEVGIFRRLSMSTEKDNIDHRSYVMVWTFVLGIQDVAPILVTFNITNSRGWDNTAF